MFKCLKFEVFHELAIYSHTTFKAHLLGLLGQHIFCKPKHEEMEQKNLMKILNHARFAQMLKIQLDEFVDLEKCYEMNVYLQGLVPIQPKTGNFSEYFT